jgi:hypothetical protein
MNLQAQTGQSATRMGRRTQVECFSLFTSIHYLLFALRFLCCELILELCHSHRTAFSAGGFAHCRNSFHSIPDYSGLLLAGFNRLLACLPGNDTEGEKEEEGGKLHCLVQFV